MPGASSPGSGSEDPLSERVSSVSCEWVCERLNRDSNRAVQSSSSPQLLLLVIDCRGGAEHSSSRIRGSVALAIPSIMLRRLAAGKVELLSTIKCEQLRRRVEEALQQRELAGQDERGSEPSFVLVGESTRPEGHQGETINALARRLRSSGAVVATLEGGFAKFREKYPEWCEGSVGSTEGQTNTDTNEGELMGLRSLRISTPPTRAYSDSDSDSTCDSIGPDDDKDFPVEILPHLYLGNAANSEDSEALARHRIQYILNVTPDLPNVFESDGTIKYMQIPISDHWSQNLASFFPQAIQFIEEARNSDKGVLVHCLAGISRSVTITVAYLMHKCNLSLNDAFNLVRSRKSNIAPNFHFMEQLHSFERELGEVRYHHYHHHHHHHHHNHHHIKRDSHDRSSSPSSIIQQGQTTTTPASGSSSSFLSPLDLGLSPDSGIEFDRFEELREDGFMVIEAVVILQPRANPWLRRGRELWILASLVVAGVEGWKKILAMWWTTSWTVFFLSFSHSKVRCTVLLEISLCYLLSRRQGVVKIAPIH